MDSIELIDTAKYFLGHFFPCMLTLHSQSVTTAFRSSQWRRWLDAISLFRPRSLYRIYNVWYLLGLLLLFDFLFSLFLLRPLAIFLVVFIETGSHCHLDWCACCMHPCDEGAAGCVRVCCARFDWSCSDSTCWCALPLPPVTTISFPIACGCHQHLWLLPHLFCVLSTCISNFFHSLRSCFKSVIWPNASHPWSMLSS